MRKREVGREYGGGIKGDRARGRIDRKEKGLYKSAERKERQSEEASETDEK